MRSILRYAICFIAAVALPGCTQDSSFVPLFNGRDLSGWVMVNGAPSTWTVRDDMIICTGLPTGVLRTTEHYENFILELEWRHLKEGGNAGLFLHSDALPVRGRPFTRAIECQILDGNHGDVFAIQGATMTPDRPHPRGAMRCLPSEERNHPAGEWNHYRVECRDGRITLAVNGKVVSGGSQTVPRRGYITLESEGSEVHFRNIRIQTLPSSNPPPEETATLDEGFVSLYNGVDLSGWQTTSAQLKHWAVQDWRLANDGQSNNGDMQLLSEKSYGNFVLIADWRFRGEEEEEPVAGVAGILLRGSANGRINIWDRPEGSGGTALTPNLRADSELGRWNRFVVTLKGDELSVVLNDETVVDKAQVAQLPDRGPIGLVNQGAPIQFANLYIKELP